MGKTSFRILLTLLLWMSPLSATEWASLSQQFSNANDPAPAYWACYRAFFEDPSLPESRLRELEQQLGLPKQQVYPPADYPFLQKTLFPLLIFTFLLLSLAIWLRSPLSKRVAFAFLLLFLGTFSFLKIQALSTPVYATLIRPAPLFTEADVTSPTVQGDFLFAGTLVKVRRESEGDFFFVETLTGEIGYLPVDHLRSL